MKLTDDNGEATIPPTPAAAPEQTGPSITLFDDYVLVLPKKAWRGPGGLHLPGKDFDDSKRMGTVLAVGPGRIANKEEVEGWGTNMMQQSQGGPEALRVPFRWPMKCAVGDLVIYHRAMECRPVGPAGPVHFIVKDTDICAKVDGIEADLEADGAPIETRGPTVPGGGLIPVERPPLAIANAAGQVTGIVPAG